MRRRVLVVSAIIAGASGVVAQVAAPVGEFRVADPRSLGMIEIGVEGVRDARFSPRPISDLMIRLEERYTPPPRSTPRGWGGAAPAPLQRFVELRLFVVSAGRVSEAGRGRCDPGSTGAALSCTLECDGGTLGVHLRFGSGGEAMPVLVIGSGADEGEASGVGGLRLGACEGRAPLQLRVRGGGQEARLALEALRPGGEDLIHAEPVPVPESWGRTETTGALPRRTEPQTPTVPLPRLRSGTMRN